jgi:DHA2 family multidrug resistance protein
MPTAAAQARYPLTQGVNPWLVTVSVMLPTFMEVLDTAIASVALPYIAGSLSASNSEATWVLTSYLVANAVILPASNWFARRWGRKRFLLICVCIFTVASFFCGAAPSLGVILLARVMQGAGGGALQPLSQSILLESFPIHKRSMAMAAYGLGIVVAPVLGPTLGGWLTDTFSWRYAFYINIPVGILAFFMITRFVHDPPYIKNAKVGPFDNIGFGLLMVWTGSLQIVLDKGQEDDWFGAGGLAGAVGVALLDQPQGAAGPARLERPQLPDGVFPDCHAGNGHLYHHRHSAAVLPGDSGLHGLFRRTGGGAAGHRFVHRLADHRHSGLAH